MGKISFSVFLIHNHILCWRDKDVMDHFINEGFSPITASVFSLTYCLFIIIPASILFEKFIDKPSQIFIRNFELFMRANDHKKTDGDQEL